MRRYLWFKFLFLNFAEFDKFTYKVAVRKVIRLKEKLENPTSGVLVVSLMFNND